MYSNVTKLYGDIDLIELNKKEQPILSVVIDTEEEFDWSAVHSRENTSVLAMRSLYQVQHIFEEHNIKPCYVMDYPVASQKDGYLPLKQIFDDGACSIGAHLHPWVSPPYNELLSRSNSFPGNLPFNLEKEKIVILKDTIENKFQIRIVNYKAGRYGFGVNTASILEALGFEVDLSPSPGFNFASEGGPNFIHFTNRVFKFGSRKQLICIPCTGGFVGCTGKFMPNIYNICNTPVAVSMKIPGILSRLDVVDRIRLSPEGFLVNDLVKITKFLIKNGVTILTLSFHSPSLLPGSTPYVKDKKDLKNFLLSIREYLHFFKEECRGTFMTPEEIRSKCDNIYNEEKEIGR